MSGLIEGDAELTLELWNYLSGQLGKEDLWPIANLELDLLPCLIDMTWRGVRVDQDKVERTRNRPKARKRGAGAILRNWWAMTSKYGLLRP